MNITCKVCRHRHPVNITCGESKRRAEIARKPCVPKYSTTRANYLQFASIEECVQDLTASDSHLLTDTERDMLLLNLCQEIRILQLKIKLGELTR